MPSRSGAEVEDSGACAYSSEAWRLLRDGVDGLRSLRQIAPPHSPSCSYHRLTTTTTTWCHHQRRHHQDHHNHCQRTVATTTTRRGRRKGTTLLRRRTTTDDDLSFSAPPSDAQLWLTAADFPMQAFWRRLESSRGWGFVFSAIFRHIPGSAWSQ